MARMRSIKPEFCSSEQVVECSRDARLLFILMWMFCDDGGVHPASAKRLKMEVYPGDDLTIDDVQKLIDELSSNGLVAEFESQGKKWWQVTGWDKHQKIDRPNYKFPQFKNHSSSDRRAIVERSPPDTDTETDTELEEELNTETDSSSPLRGTYEEVTDGLLRDDRKLSEWFYAGKRFGILGSECDKLHVFGLSELALRKGRNPAAYFVGNIRKAEWKKLVTIEDEKNAESRIRKLRSSSRRNNFAPALQRTEGDR